MKKVRDWQIQTAWWVSGIFATGALWYFLSVKNHNAAVVCGLAALLVAVVAICLHVKKDGLLSQTNSSSKSGAAANTPIIDLCHRGISVRDVESRKLHFDIPYCAGKNANAHNVKLQTATLLREGSGLKILSHFGDDFPDGITLTYETGKSISYTLSPLTRAAIASLYIVVRGTYTTDVGDKIFPVFDIFKFDAPSGRWVRTLGDEDKTVRAFVLADA